MTRWDDAENATSSARTVTSGPAMTGSTTTPPTVT